MKPHFAACVAGRELTYIRRIFDGAPPDCINLGIGQPSDPIPDSVRQAASRVVESGRVPYAPTAGLPALREAIADKVYGGASPETVLVTSGSQAALWLSMMGLVTRSEEVLVSEPAYPAYQAVAEMIGATPVTLNATDENRFAIDPAAITRAWNEKTRAVVIASPANPTGMVAGNDESLAAVHRLCAENDGWLIGDEIYAPLLDRPHHAPLHSFGDRVIALGGISKAFSGMGFRTGWLHAHPEVIKGLLPLQQMIAISAPTVGQHAAIACLELWGDGYFKPLRQRYAERRAAAITALGEIPNISFQEPDGGFFVFVDVSAYTTSTFEFALELRDKERVMTAPGEAFGASFAGHIRLSFALEPDQIREGIARIGRLLLKQTQS